MDLETFVEHASTFARLQRHVGRSALLRALQAEDSLHYEDADHVADFLEELSEDLADEVETQRLAETVRRAPRGGG